MVELFKALADENRIRIINLVLEAELCVCEIETILKMTQSNASRHLTKLKAVGIISSSKEAQWVHYKVDENFKSENMDLINYLKTSISIIEICNNDLERYKKYKTNGLSCTDIRANSERVLEIIK